ncbi:MAG: fibronectin type III domain-containing protein [Phycisphaeraceae bacterium]|nr:fibronectin type III domain-containing protein [Phycisphaeraceae bacterium]
MALLPDDRLGRIEFFEERLNAWANSAAAIGLTPAQIVEIESLTQAARSAYGAANLAEITRKAATNKLRTDARNMRVFGAALIATIKAYAEANNDPSVYEKALIDPPSPRGEGTPPDQPRMLRASLDTDGSLVLTWKGKGPGGTRYDVTRLLPGDGGFKVIGDTSKKRWVDNDLPAGTGQVLYRVIARQTGFEVGSTILTVRLGNTNQEQIIGQAA